MNRYGQLKQIVSDVKPKTIVEVGTWNGERAIELLSVGPAHYVGFDLFEFATDETDKAELNVKRHHTKAEVEAKLEAFCKEHPDRSFELIAGDTKSTLPALISKGLKPGLAFVDGGHSVATILSDISALKDCPVVVSDDYYTPDQEGKCPDISEYGCNFIVSEGGWLILPAKDGVVTGGHVQMVVRGWTPKKQNLVVKTKNCVEDAEIQKNVAYTVSKNLPSVKVCGAHQNIAVFCGGGRLSKKVLGEIRDLQSNGAYVIAVKTSHDKLIRNGIIPWGCILLDPRDHARQFINELSPETVYFTASMVHPSTLDHLIERGARICVYHALVNAGEAKIVGDGMLVSGGSAAMTRGIALLYSVLGFHRYVLYGFDCCYPSKKSKPHGIAKKEVMKVEIMGRKFWTDLELIAQAQDFGNLISQANLSIDVRGNGMISHIWKNKRPKFTLDELTNAA
jgi:hypothetical protein